MQCNDTPKEFNFFSVDEVAAFFRFNVPCKKQFSTNIFFNKYDPIVLNYMI